MAEEIRPTVLKRMELYQDRWSSYGANTGIKEIAETPSAAYLKQIDIFQEYDDAFLEKISQDVSLAVWKKDAVLFDERAYIDGAFYILQCQVEVFLRKLQQARKMPLFESHRTRMLELPAKGQAAQPEPEPEPVEPRGTKLASPGQGIAFLSVLDFNLPTSGSGLMLGPGEFFGEIGALSGWPQSVTARAASDLQVVQIRVPALRLMRKRSSGLKDRIDTVYRKRFLPSQLKSTPLFQKCDDPFLESLARRVELVSCEPDEVITKEGEPADALYVV